MLDSGQSTLFRGGGGEDIIDVLLKIWLNVPNVLATIVGQSWKTLHMFFQNDMDENVCSFSYVIVRACVQLCFTYPADKFDNVVYSKY